MKRIAVLSSGGDAPGMNAAIRAVVRSANYHGLHVFGIYEGYQGLIEGKVKRLERGDVANIIHRGGTILKSSRSEEFRSKEGRAKAYQTLQAHEVEGLIVLGGNGTFTGAKLFSEEHNIPVIGIPGTIDNDIFGTDFTIGFDTAINTAIEAVDRIRDTADSHNRLFLIEVMGRHSGYIALYTGIASGSSHVFLPEVNSDMDQLIEMLRKSAIRNKLFNLIIVAEGNPLGGANKMADILEDKLEGYEIKVAIIGHLQRGGSPTGRDRVLASRLGFAAVDSIMSGKSNLAMGVIDGQISYTSFDDAITKEKSLDSDLVAMAKILAQ